MLAREIRDLDRGIQPIRDLWPGIERKIEAHPQRRRAEAMATWMPWGVAASLLMAISALTLTLVRENPLTTQPVSFDRSMDEMRAEYIRVRNPLVQEFEKTNQNLDPETLEDLYRNIEIMEQARREIEDQVRKDPENRRLVEMLMKIHAQELDLLKRDYTRPTHSM